MSFEEFIHLRVELDSSDGGLTSSQFRNMVGECGIWERIMLARSKDQHRCPGKTNAHPKFKVPEKKLFSLLDSTAGGQGITRNQFQYSFLSCITCRLVFTRAAACRHTHIDDTSDDDIFG